MITREIDPNVTEADAKYLLMTPDERQQHLASQGHAFPIAQTDEQVWEWFNDLGQSGKLRLRLAQEKNNDLS